MDQQRKAIGRSDWMQNLITLNGAFYWWELKIVPRLSRDVTGGKKRNLDSSETKRTWSLSLYIQHSVLFIILVQNRSKLT